MFLYACYKLKRDASQLSEIKEYNLYFVVSSL